MTTQTTATGPAEQTNTGDPKDHVVEKPTPQALEAQNHDAGIDGDNGREKSVFKALGWLDRFLAVWIFLAMLVGILLGNFVPETGPALEKGKFVGVSVPIGKPAKRTRSRRRPVGDADGGTWIAIGLLVMMYPILCKVRYESLHEILGHKGMWKQILFSVLMNWIVAPFLMVRNPRFKA